MLDGRIMGLDVGTKRIGIALSDFLLITAQPCETIQREPEEKAIEKIVNLCAENCVASIPACLSAFLTRLWTASTLMRLPLREPNRARLSVSTFLLRSGR